MADIRHMVTLRFDRHRLRHAVWLTLVAWLFALTAGVVNACMLTPQGGAGSDIDAASFPRTVVHAEQASPASEVAGFEHEGQLAPHGQGQDPGKGSCLKFCDDGSTALSNDRASAPDPGVPPLAAIAPWSPFVEKAGLGARLSLRQPGARGPSLVIRYLRLTR